MTTALTTQTSNSPASYLPAIDRGVELLIEWCMAGSQRVGGRLMLANWPSTEERKLLQQRHKLLVGSLRSDPRKVAAAVSDLLSSYRNALRPGEDAKHVTANYAKELQQVPTWAVERTCSAIRSGSYPEHANFPPSTIALRMIADSYVKRVHDEATRIFEIMHAERGAAPVSEANRTRVGNGLRSLSQHLGSLVDTLKTQVDPHAAELAVKREAVLAEGRARRTQAKAESHQEAAE